MKDRKKADFHSIGLQECDSGLRGKKLVGYQTDQAGVGH